jgi:hypothetical protein
MMAKRITAPMIHTLKVHKETPISMKWKEDASKEYQGSGEAKNGVGEGRDSKTRKTVFQCKIIIVEGERMRQL